MTLYLKYRPQTVEELDLRQAREAITDILKKDHLPHALLFSGPRGTGKTSAARIVAKTINCVGAIHESPLPCGKCEMCVGITSGSAVDVVEIDAASNRGIDEMRELREKIRLAPMQAKHKVYIIDEVHMLTTEAANAILKTLEEPPPNTVFVLCTTDPQKLPETVISRCTRVQFKKPSLEEIIEKLEKVVRGEKLKVDHKDLELIAKAAKGSFRDAIKILEQASVSEQPVAQVLGMLESADPKRFIQLLRSGDSSAGLAFIAKAMQEGINIRTFIEQCVEVLREEVLETMDKEVIVLIEEFEKVYGQSKDAAVPQLPLEILVIKNSNTAPLVKPVKGEVLGGDKLQELVGKWPELLKLVKPHNHSVEALMRSTKPINFDGQTLTLEVFYKFHKDKLETEKCREIVEMALGELFGRRGKLILKLGQKSASQPEEDLAKIAEGIFK